MRRISKLILFSILLFVAAQSTTAAPFATSSSEEEQNKLIIALLNPAIENSIVGYYGEPKLYDSAKIIEIKTLQPGSSIFTVKVVLTTFTGPHNPPYGRDTIKLKVDTTSTKVESFEHEKM
ncbi:hypothetical protein B1A99_25205 [Cohnella sp. CIP 111063]|uniref:DUF3888 domain-containing protein n=1 Tax=unclassified Cohnella TaxID=2636738 RepID=UPI000B8BF579|nr:MULTISPECIES: DUF3888 domain-containing protein [unclassified Cohnella]OXS55078.1 hypothetical protein B1A99_25205 [Cohnella sp. CIP 111063]